MEVVAGQYSNAGPPTATANTDLPAQVDALGRFIIVGGGVAGTPAGGVASIQGVTGGTPVNVTISSVVGSVTYGAPTAVAVTAGPTSTTLIAANAARKTLSIWNPIGNAQMSVDVSGGVAVLTTGRPLLAGDSIDLTDDDCPVGAVTFIGTAGQSLVVQQGT